MKHGLSLTLLSMRLHTINPFSYLQQELLTRMGMGRADSCILCSECTCRALCVPRAPSDRSAAQRGEGAQGEKDFGLLYKSVELSLCHPLCRCFGEKKKSSVNTQLHDYKP